MRFQPSRPAVIFFDLDDTLIHEEATDRDVADEVAAALLADRQLPPGALFTAVQTTARTLWQQSGELAYCRRIGTSSIEGLYGDFSGDDPHLQALRKYLQEIGYRERAWSMALRSFGIDDAALTSRLAAAYAETRRSRHVQFPDALPALQRLSRSFRLALMTARHGSSASSWTTPASRTSSTR
jgi:putative hydrolase of the HAD superfamily